MHQSRALRTLDWQSATRFTSALCMALDGRDRNPMSELKSDSELVDAYLRHFAEKEDSLFWAWQQL